MATLSNGFSSFRGHGNGDAHAPARAAEETTLSLARRRPGDEPGLRKGEDARGRHRPRYYPAMSEYDSWAQVYDAWASGMPVDVAHYVALARDAEGPIVELAVGTGRVALEVARETGKPVLGIDSSASRTASFSRTSASLRFVSTSSLA